MRSSEVMDMLGPIQALVEQAASIRPFMLKTADGWETLTVTPVLEQAIAVRDAIWQRVFETMEGFIDEV